MTGHIITGMARVNVREQLIDGGLQTLYRQGFNGCSIQDITEAAGVPKGSFYNHFASKEELALATLERFWEANEKRRTVLSDSSLDPVERLRLHFQLLSDALARAQFQHGCLIGNFSSEMALYAEVRNRLGDIYATWTNRIATCIDEAAKAGRVCANASPASIAAFLINSWEGAVLRAKVEQRRDALDDFSAVVFSSVFS